ncbi:MAG: hypothetical protein QOE72_3725 [Chloroflexota bacterium]|jgi:hypothetical protein|nr:hypothetical protein [Chloroflexota bacterium]
MGTGRRRFRVALSVAILGGCALAAVPAAASARGRTHGCRPG